MNEELQKLGTIITIEKADEARMDNDGRAKGDAGANGNATRTMDGREKNDATDTINGRAATNVFTMTDAELYSKCKHFGEIARKYRTKFAGLLPEVARRRLYEKKGFGSIFEFAAKLAGMSEEQVSRVLHLEEKFEKTPTLKAMLQNGEASFHKLSRVASVATPENQDFWAAQIKLLPQRALETLVRDARALPQENFDSLFVHAHTKLTQNSECATATTEQMLTPAPPASQERQADYNNHNDLNLSPEVHQRLLNLQQKGININQLILEFLNEREREIEEEKNHVANQIKYKQELNAEAESHGIPIQNSRYIPAKIRKLIKKEFGEKCAVTTCSKNAEEIHHTNRFSMTKNHNPYFLAPLCVEHHKIAHTIDLQFHNARLRAAG